MLPLLYRIRLLLKGLMHTSIFSMREIWQWLRAFRILINNMNPVPCAAATAHLDRGRYLKSMINA